MKVFEVLDKLSPTEYVCMIGKGRDFTSQVYFILWHEKGILDFEVKSLGLSVDDNVGILVIGI